MTKSLLTAKDIKLFIQDCIADYKRNYTMNRKELAIHVNKSEATIGQYIEKGMPWFGHPQNKRFNVAVCEEWIKNEVRNYEMTSQFWEDKKCN